MTKMLALVLLAAFGTAAPAAADCRFTLHFAYGSAALRLADTLLLRDIARGYPEGRVALTAHADDDGSPAANARIARARGDAVVAQLGRFGLGRDRVTQMLPLAADWDAVPRRAASSPLNRRVELFVGGCNPAAHRQARPLSAAGIDVTPGGRVVILRPLEPGF